MTRLGREQKHLLWCLQDGCVLWQDGMGAWRLGETRQPGRRCRALWEAGLVMDAGVYRDGRRYQLTEQATRLLNPEVDV